MAGRAELPSMAGRVVEDGQEACFVPGFPFVDGTGYVIEAQGQTVAQLVQAPHSHSPAARVIAIRPSAAEVPRNLLRLYVWFSAPMTEGVAAEHVHLLGQDGAVMEGSIMPGEYELWDLDRRRLTVLLDPARIKRGLAPHREVGYPLQEGQSFTLTVGAAFPDARGVSMQGGAEQRFLVGCDERRRIDPETWQIASPRVDSREPVRISFDRALDHGLLLRCLRIVDDAGRPVPGAVSITPGERAWTLTPSLPWQPGRHRVMVDPVLEDVAGNSVTRVFDQGPDSPGAVPGSGPITLGFQPGPAA
jgi:hypothetical protein